MKNKTLLEQINEDEKVVKNIKLQVVNKLRNKAFHRTNRRLFTVSKLF